jgi:hypothetical protein
MTHGSLFTGKGGFDFAAELEGITTLWQCEINPFLQRELRQRYPDATLYDDITTIPLSDLEYVDIITGGFPCQPFSMAGQRRGAEDHRYLWPAMRKVIEHVRPRYVLVENVVGIKSMALPLRLAEVEGETVLLRVIRDLIRLGYEFRSCPTLPQSFAVFQLVPQVPATAATESGSPPLLKTPTQSQFEGATPAGGSSSSGTLAQQMQQGLIPTPKAQNANSPAQHGQGGMDLQTFIQLLPTPNASDGTGGKQRRQGSYSVTGQTAKGKVQVSLQERLSLLPTPQAMDGIKSPKWFAGGNPSLPHTIAMLPPPTVNGNYNRQGLSEKSGDGLATAILGQNSGLRLSAAFVRWMMGYPPDYDDVSAVHRIKISTSKDTATP